MVNVIAVIVAAIVSFAFGSLWYSPILFGKLWMKLSKVDMKNSKKGMGKIMTAGFITTLIIAFILELLIDLLNIN